MSTLQLAIGTGMLVGLGLFAILWRVVPAEPQLGGALSRINPERRQQETDVPAAAANLQDRIGLLVQRRLNIPGWVTIPRRELALLQIPVHRYLGEKALYLIIGVLFPSILVVTVDAFNLVTGGQPWLPTPLIPVGAGLALGAALFLLPDYNARSDAKTAHVEFTRGLIVFFDLVALERISGTGTTQALTEAAKFGDSWVFRRLREELQLAKWRGITPWDGLRELSVDIGITELADLADTMRLAGESGAAVAQSLKAKAGSMRNALLSEDLAQANAAGEKLTFPVTALALVFLVLLAVPAVLRVYLGS